VNPLWSYFWPAFALGVLAGVATGIVAFRRKHNRSRQVVAGLIAALALAALWHGPIGAADRFAARVERDARATLDFYEMTKVSAHLHHGPLSRRLVLSGPADDFQSTELVRTMDTLPGVSQAQWQPSPGGMPLIVEGLAVAVLGFLLGLLLAYLVELRRRYNAQWNW
jgi:membrane protease YdiL (CAAX protease family)